MLVPNFPTERHGGSGDHNLSPTRDVTISKLPVEILLEIFDFYRQSFEVERKLNYERDWNNKNGWFKLAHVCQNWRSVVLAFSSRLQLRLYFTAHTPTRAAALTALSTLPIIINYPLVPWTVTLKNRLTSTPGYPNRVCKIALTVTYSSSYMISNVLDFTFPTLTSLELHHVELPPSYFPSTFLTTSLKCLRRLKILDGTLASLPPLLSATTALVDLTLDVQTTDSTGSAVSFLSLLQCLPLLRHLDVSVAFHHVHPIHAIPESVSLAELTSLRFKGSKDLVEQLIPRLAIPSLQNLHVSLCSKFTSRVPHLSNLIHNAGIFFFAAQIMLSQSSFTFSLLTNPHLTHDTHFSIITERPSSIAEIGSELSEMLATVEDVTVAFRYPAEDPTTIPVNLPPWCGFFEWLQNVKMLRLQHNLEIQVADMLRQDDGRPTTNLFPSLEGIEVYKRHPDVPILESEGISGFGPFEAFVSARQQAGRPVKVCWHRDQVLPTPFYRVRDWSNR